MGAGTGFDQGGSSSSTQVVYTYKQTIKAAQMAKIGTSPLLLLNNPGSDKFNCVIPSTLCFRKSGGTTNGYTFDASTTGFGLGWINGGFMDYFSVYDLTGSQPASVATKFLQGVTAVRVLTWTDPVYYYLPSSNVALYLTTSNAVNPTAGDNDIIVSFNYTIIDVS